MFKIKDNPVSVMVMYAVSLHYWWTICILMDNATLASTPLSAIHRYASLLDGRFGGTLFITIILPTVATLAIIATFARRPWMVLLLVPQQIILLMTASGAIEAVWIAQFADGVTRPRFYIAASQANSVLACLGHTVAMYYHAKRQVFR